MPEKHIVKHWKGSIESYNFLKSHNALDAWTLYYVTCSGNTIVQYFGNNKVQEETGQLLPVETVLSGLPSDPIPYGRYLVGDDELGYEIYEYTPEKIDGSPGYTLSVRHFPFDTKYGVRVRDEGLKNFVYNEGKLVSYDDVDCGDF